MTLARIAALTVAVMLAPAAAHADSRALPAAAEAALQAAGVPREAVSVLVQEIGPLARNRLVWNAERPMNPASVTKLLTTYAALDLLGPGHTWVTGVWLQGKVADGVLDGNLVVKGSGDPKLVVERLWLLLRRVQAMGVREIRGDIVLDRSVFPGPERDPAEFDGEPLRPHNAQADALLLNFRALTLSFTPDPARGVARVGVEPPLAGLSADTSVPLTPLPCEDWRAGLRADFSDPAQLRLAGTYPAACGEKQWLLAPPEPGRYAARMLAALWAELGGRLGGSVRDGSAPATRPTFELVSPTLAEVVRDINKFSNNVMAQQVFLTLGLAHRGSGTPEAAREALRRWIATRLGRVPRDLVIDNGSGLSRETRMSCAFLARLLQVAWAGPVMPELASSLSAAGIDGTLRRVKGLSGRAHLKTGSLRDVAALAGYVLSAGGRRYVLVAMINHPNANEARAALDALVQWVGNDGDEPTAPRADLVN